MVPFFYGRNDKPIQIKNQQAPNESKKNGGPNIVKDGVKRIATGDKCHNCSKENGCTDTCVLGSFPWGTSF